MNLSLFKTETIGSTLVVVPTQDLGELQFQGLQEQGSALLNRFHGSAEINILVDLSVTDFFGSSTISLLLDLDSAARERGGKLSLCNLSDHEREILTVSGLAARWPIHDSREAALQANGDDEPPSQAGS